jgi:hypothetical protein
VNGNVELCEVLIVLGLKVQKELLKESNAEALEWLHQEYFKNLLALGAVVLITYESEAVRYSICLKEAKKFVNEVIEHMITDVITN